MSVSQAYKNKTIDKKIKANIKDVLQSTKQSTIKSTKIFNEKNISELFPENFNLELNDFFEKKGLLSGSKHNILSKLLKWKSIFKKA